ncbi:hypothetical protein [Litchfieldia alkalitelluris]|uniref:hypothetical protein n=1 Tax=Litchfieldia alkalitelluris TaxID=304268 RepID=UPI000998182D|nr:hypothetical protein [Litchfieldia alkalitelluris]
MDILTKKLRASLLENPAVQLKESAVWFLPVLVLDVNFKRVRRAKMDILMKMMLLTFEEADIRRAANLSEMLLVEDLFIEDLIKKMQRTGLIILDKSIYRLTTKGHEQLKTGIIEEELEDEYTELFYSSSHDEYWVEETVSVTENDAELPVYRYANNEDRINDNRILQTLSEKLDGPDEDGFQTVVADIVGFEQQKVEQVPCLEFRLYNVEQDIFYARVWNTLLGQWDDTLEKQIEERERVKWREKWKGDIRRQ